MPIFPVNQPQLILVGGSNGSGKTTTANVLIDTLGFRYLGADEIAKELNPDNVERAERQAGEIFIHQIKEAISNKESLIVESTLSGLTLPKHIKRAKLNGYVIKVVYIYLDSVDISIFRVKLRVEQGGHNVPEDAIRRRFPRSRKNFWNIYRLLSDSWELYYNSIDESLNVEMIATGTMCPVTNSEDVTVLDLSQWKIFLGSIGEPYDDTE